VDLVLARVVPAMKTFLIGGGMDPELEIECQPKQEHER